MDESAPQIYSDLRPVSNNAFERMQKEFLESWNKQWTLVDGILPRKGESVTINYKGVEVAIACEGDIGFFRFTVRICYGFGLKLGFVFCESEAAQTLSVAKLSHDAAHHDTARDRPSLFFRLPAEIRLRIYHFAIPRGEQSVEDIENFNRDCFLSGMGDPSGFYYPLGHNLSILRVSRQIRREAFPFAYRRTDFLLDDMDDAIKFLIAVGQTGRENIESLQFSWTSRADSWHRWEEYVQAEGGRSLMPELHVSALVMMMKQCKRLRSLRLCFEDELIRDVPPAIFMADPGIRELCSVRGIRKFDIWDPFTGYLKHCSVAKLLREEITGSVADEVEKEVKE
ncbi:hypothetical protein TARUN_8925 [Trichoderma arundinaceum]|uniref:Uncharacterized protein n=1 Tax=Trichoderma arundinaceum TaxID=490622 RepID=A0A395NC05_TRIAR|nr:hypothetical protein TARUN_8925 [Trichoderma arundinaceum]